MKRCAADSKGERRDHAHKRCKIISPAASSLCNVAAKAEVGEEEVGAWIRIISSFSNASTAGVPAIFSSASKSAIEPR